MTDRRYLINKFGYKYNNLAICDSKFINKCFYCGENMNCYDHAPPLDMLRNVDGLYKGKYLLVPSCTSCNLLLGSGTTWSLQERAELAKSKIFQKNNKSIIKGERWSLEDLKEFDHTSSLFPEILKTKFISFIAIERLLFANPMFYIGSDKDTTYLLGDTTKKYDYLRNIYSQGELDGFERLFRKYLYK